VLIRLRRLYWIGHVALMWKQNSYINCSRNIPIVDRQNLVSVK